MTSVFYPRYHYGHLICADSRSIPELYRPLAYVMYQLATDQKYSVPLSQYCEDSEYKWAHETTDVSPDDCRKGRRYSCKPVTTSTTSWAVSSPYTTTALRTTTTASRITTSGAALCRQHWALAAAWSVVKCITIFVTLGSV